LYLAGRLDAGQLFGKQLRNRARGRDYGRLFDLRLFDRRLFACFISVGPESKTTG
jgi:hypothetical protein